MSRPQQGVRLRRTKASPNWYIYYNENGSTRRRSTGLARFEDAESKLGEFIFRQKAGRLNNGPKPASHYTIAEAISYYCHHHAVNLQSVKHQIRCGERLLEFFNDMTVDDVTTGSVNNYCSHRRDRHREKGRGEMSDGTLRRELNVLSAALRFCEKEGHLDRAPKVYLPKEPPGKTLCLTPADVTALIAACEAKHIEFFIIIAVHTAARSGAIRELTWSQIDFPKRLVYLNPERRSQTNKGRAIVKMTDELLAALTEAKKSATGINLIEYRGGPVGSIKKAFKRSCMRAADRQRERACKPGVAPDRKAELLASANRLSRTSPHTLRHTAGSWMAEEGISLLKIAAFMGHSGLRTAQLYAHLQPDHLTDAAAAISRRANLG